MTAGAGKAPARAHSQAQNPSVSIIIPVYNAEKFLGTCLKSVETAFERLFSSEISTRGEIVLVDNGSSDGSLEVARAFSKSLRERQGKALALSILECQTPGASAARNFGVARAKGEYLWFVDADDRISPDSLVKLLAAAKNVDFVMLGVKRIYPGGKNQDGKRDYLPALPASAPDFKSRFIRYGIGPWQVLLRRAWWQEHGLAFKEGIIHEDMALLSTLVLYTDHFSSVDQPLYLYYQNPDSVLHKTTWDPHYLDIFPALEELHRRFQEVKMPSAAQTTADFYAPELEWFFIWNLLLDSAKDFAGHPEGRSGFKKTRQLLKKYYPRWRHNRFLRQKPLKTRLRVRLNYWR